MSVNVGDLTKAMTQAMTLQVSKTIVGGVLSGNPPSASIEGLLGNNYMTEVPITVVTLLALRALEKMLGLDFL